MIGHENSHLSLNQSYARPDENQSRLDHPHFKQLTRFYFEFSLDLKDVFHSSDWLLRVLWFWFCDTQSKSALYFTVGFYFSRQLI